MGEILKASGCNYTNGNISSLGVMTFSSYETNLFVYFSGEDDRPAGGHE